jgi:hypothetical protein
VKNLWSGCTVQPLHAGRKEGKTMDFLSWQLICLVFGFFLGWALERINNRQRNNGRSVRIYNKDGRTATITRYEILRKK